MVWKCGSVEEAGGDEGKRMNRKSGKDGKVWPQIRLPRVCYLRKKSVRRNQANCGLRMGCAPA